MSKLLLTNGKIVYSQGTYNADLLIEDGIISEIAPKINSKNVETIDIKNNIVMPAFVDLHCHLRQSIETNDDVSETIATGTKSAVAGGYGAVVAMPNTTPATDSIAKIKSLREIANENANCYVSFASSITQDRAGQKCVDIEELAQNGVSFFTDDGDCVENLDVVYEAMTRMKKVGATFAQHSEAKALSKGHINEGVLSELYNIQGRNELAETSIIARDIEIAKATNVNYHVLHASTIRSIELVKAAKSHNITVEVCPHHLFFNESFLQQGKENNLSTLFKMNPPLRSHYQVKELRKALKNGLIDAISTDHAPHLIKKLENSLEVSTEDFCCAPAGIIGIQNANWIVSNILKTPYEIAKVMSVNPAKIAKLNDLDFGKYPKVGNKAHLTIMSTQESSEQNNFSKSENSPYMLLDNNDSYIYMTIVDGKIKYMKEK